MAARTQHEAAEHRATPDTNVTMHFAHILERLTDGFITLDTEDRYVYVNRRAERLLGRSCEELLGINVWAAFPGGADSVLGRAIEIARTGDAPVTCEDYATTLGLWFEYHIYPSSEGLLSIYFRDITERKGTEEEYERFFTHSFDMLCIAGSDGYFKRLNPAWQETLGFSEAELLAAPIIEFVHPEDQAATLASRGKISQGTLTPNFENRYRCRDGSYRWLQWNTVSDGEKGLKYGVAHDITERKQAEAALAESENRFRISVDAMEEGLTLQDADGSILFCNESAERILGLAANQLRGRIPQDTRWRATRADGSDFPGDQHPAMLALREAAPQRNVIMGIRKPNDEEPEGALTWVNINAVPLLDAAPKNGPHTRRVQGVVVTFSDITQRIRAEDQIKGQMATIEIQKAELEKTNAELAMLATTDGLTGLRNHRAFQERMAEEVIRAARYDTPLCVLLLDVDCFKQFNDAHGHLMGDTVLESVAFVLQRHARDTDTVARYGGEEFVLILPQTDLGGALAFAERLRAALERHAWPVQTVTASFGVANLWLGEAGGTDMMARADEALYRSKTAGRNRVTCSSSLSSPTQQRHDLLA